MKNQNNNSIFDSVNFTSMNTMAWDLSTIRVEVELHGTSSVTAWAIGYDGDVKMHMFLATVSFDDTTLIKFLSQIVDLGFTYRNIEVAQDAREAERKFAMGFDDDDDDDKHRVSRQTFKRFMQSRRAQLKRVINMAGALTKQIQFIVEVEGSDYCFAMINQFDGLPSDFFIFPVGLVDAQLLEDDAIFAIRQEFNATQINFNCNQCGLILIRHEHTDENTIGCRTCDERISLFHSYERRVAVMLEDIARGEAMRAAAERFSTSDEIDTSRIRFEGLSGRVSVGRGIRDHSNNINS